ncbi:unannotated protein [freshwater metagenome]|uniref:Unannotated protein n=1 Tax=freshwater metagenome TaxID=449393 RepID=A0A6J7MIG2_9ZZZZ
MLLLVAGHPSLDEWVECQASEEDARHDDSRNQDVPADGPPVEEICLPVRHDAKRTVEEAHVPVRLRTSADLIWHERPEDPDWVNGDETTDERDDAEDDEEEAACLCHVDRQERVPDDVLIRAARTRELGVLLGPDEHEVNGDEREDETRDKQDVHRVQPRYEVVARELAVEEQECCPRPDDWHGLSDASSDLEPGAGQKIVGQ